jgi:flagellar biosynthesis/type III secretory pathway chaperone
MSASAPTLASILTDEAALYEELLDVLTEEEAALARGDSGVVAASLPRKETIALKLRLLERSREATVTRMTGRAECRLRELPGADLGDLGAARRRLSAALEAVVRANDRVDALLSRALARLRATLDFLHEAAGAGRHYTADAALVAVTMPTVDGRA